MFTKTTLCSLFVCVALAIPSRLTAEGLGLGESKEDLKLKYDLQIKDHGTGRVTAILQIADEGRLKPLTSVSLLIPNRDGTNFVDLSVDLKTRMQSGKKTARVHLHRDLAQRARLQLSTRTLDGKQEPLTWYFHSIKLAKHLKPEKGK